MEECKSDYALFEMLESCENFKLTNEQIKTFYEILVGKKDFSIRNIDEINTFIAFIMLLREEGLGCSIRCKTEDIKSEVVERVLDFYTGKNKYGRNVKGVCVLDEGGQAEDDVTIVFFSHKNPYVRPIIKINFSENKDKESVQEFGVLVKKFYRGDITPVKVRHKRKVNKKG